MLGEGVQVGSFAVGSRVELEWLGDGKVYLGNHEHAPAFLSLESHEWVIWSDCGSSI